jgi:hypothetical protein
MTSISDLYGWTTSGPHPGWSAARAYGWGFHPGSPTKIPSCHCTRCGAEIPIQRAGFVYECEHCANTREE